MREPGYQRIRGGLPVGETIPDKLPRASSVSISGTVQPGNEITGSYDYSDDLTAEGTSTYNWYLSDDALGTNKAQISGETGLTYTVAALDDGKFVSFEVTPVDAGAVAGAAVESAREEVTAPAWAAYLDNTHWESTGEFIWSTNKWVLSTGGPNLDHTLGAIGTWASGFRPTKARLTYTMSLSGDWSCAGFEICCNNDNDTIYSAASDPGTGVEINLSGYTGDITFIRFQFAGESGGVTLNITNIEFYG